MSVVLWYIRVTSYNIETDSYDQMPIPCEQRRFG